MNFYDDDCYSMAEECEAFRQTEKLRMSIALEAKVVELTKRVEALERAASKPAQPTQNPLQPNATLSLKKKA